MIVKLVRWIVVLALVGCAGGPRPSEEAAGAVRQHPLEGLPYHPVAYHLDLAILAYQLYGQSLAWPFDPYYEDAGERARLMDRVRAWARREGAAQVARRVGVEGYRGPGALAGFADNPRLDPIIYRYDRLHPWSHTVTHGDGRWTEYRTPQAVTDPIGEVRVCYRRTASAIDQIQVATVARRAGGRDQLLVFEGLTGDKGEAGQAGAQSVLGFVLLRHRPDAGYDLHIAFRGSRSGSAARAAGEALSDRSASGNPDWVTDLGYDRVQAPRISQVGTVARGFARSIELTLPRIYACLGEAARLGPGGAPVRIYVTGHSLGGALAQHFASAMLLGEARPGFHEWPWARLKLLTYGAPRAGDEAWARAMAAALDARFFSSPVDPFDRAALAVTDPSLVPRLVAADHPAAFRVLLSTDPITSGKVGGGKHVGTTVYLDAPRAAMPLDFAAHEPFRIRARLLATLRDSRIPREAWRYLDMKAVNPERRAGEHGTPAEYRRMATAARRYYRDRHLAFDHAGLASDAALFQRVLTGAP